ncbi:MAG: AAA family ATPase [Myxococcaceae bacterium]|nr:AAA family ATPase [Myxococcaceae bacterium]
MPSFVVRLPDAQALRRFGEETRATRSCFVATEAETDMGALLELEVSVGARRVALQAEVCGLEVDATGRAGLRVALEDAALTALSAFVEAVAGPAPTPLDEEPTTNPDLLALGPVPLTAPPAVRLDASWPIPSAPRQSSGETAVRIDAAAPVPNSPHQPSGVAPTLPAPGIRIDAARPVPSGRSETTPAPQASAIRIDAARPVPSAPRQPSESTPAPQPPAIRIDAARPVPSAPSETTPAPQASGIRIDAARPVPSAPRQPSESTPAPQPPAIRIDAARPVPSAPRQPSETTPAPQPPAIRIDAARPVPSAPPETTPAPQASGIRIDAARPVPSAPSETAPAPQPPAIRIDAARPVPSAPSDTTPTPQPPAIRIDAARPVPSAPRQPSETTPTPQPPAIRIDAARPVPSAPRQPSETTPARLDVAGRQPGAESSPPAGPRPPSVTSPPSGVARVTRPDGTGLTPAFTPMASTRATAPDGRVGRLSELNAALGFPLSPQRLAHAEHVRAQLPEVMPIAWLLGVEFGRSTDPLAFSTLLSLCVDVAVPLGGALDVFSQASAVFVFFGLGSQANAALAAAELRERLELLADGQPAAPTLKLALTGSRLRADPDTGVEGDGLQSLQTLLRRATAGQCHAARNLALGVSDLVEWAPANDDMRLVGRRAAPINPPASVGLEPLLRLLDTRVLGLERGAVSPVVVTGPRRSGRSHLALEFARRAHAQGCLVAHTTSLKGDGRPLSAVVELLCQVARVPFEARHAALAPALEALRVAPERRHAALVLAGIEPSPTPFTPRQVTDALRLVLADVADGRRRVLVFDGLDHADAESARAFVELFRTPQPRELLVGLASPELAASLSLDATLGVPTLTLAEVDALLTASLGSSPVELRDVLFARSGGYPGLVMELLLLTASRGGLRPRGETLMLEGTVPLVAPAELPRARLLAEGTRVARLLEVVWLLGDFAESATVARVLPDVTNAAWPRAVAARFLMGNEGRASLVPTFDAVLTTFSGTAAVAARCAAAIAATGTDTLAGHARVARLLERANEPSRAGAQWRLVAERAVAARDLFLAAVAQEGMARALERHPQKESSDILPLRLSAFARAACARLALRDVDGAAHCVAEGLAATPPGQPPDAELSLAEARVRRAQGRDAEAREALSAALAASKGLPVYAAALAELAEAHERAGDTVNAEAAWHQALAGAEALGALGPWLGELDFRARVESRIGALFIGRQQHGRARTWLVSAAERFKAAGAPLYASRVLANLGALSAQASAWTDAESWFRQAATTAEAGGDFLFQAKQLVSLARVLARLNDASTAEVATQAANLAEALEWPEGVAAMRALR